MRDSPLSLIPPHESVRLPAVTGAHHSWVKFTAFAVASWVAVGCTSTPAPRASSFGVVENVVQVDQPTYHGSCPVKLTFSGRIAVSGGAGIVSYRFVRSDNASAPAQTVTFTRPGSQ